MIAVAPRTHGARLREIAHAAQGRAQHIELWINARPFLAFLSLTVFYFAVVSVLSSLKLLWLDELITLHIARLPDAHAIWNALSRGADPNPPLVHLLVHVLRRFFGEHEFVLRLPAIMGYWLGVTCLFAFLRRRVPATWAMAGAVLSMATGAFEYSYESRSYGVFYGLAMAAVFCWSVAADRSRARNARRAGVFGMGLALLLGLCTNYFAVLAFFPVAAGELARTYLQVRDEHFAYGFSERARAFLRSIDWPIWIAMAVAVLPLLVFRTLIAHSIAQFAPYAWNKVSLDQAFDSYVEMVEVVTYPILALLFLWILLRVLSRMCGSCRARVRPRWLGELASRARVSEAAVPLREAVAVFFLMAYPFLGYAVASIRGGMLSPRFVIPVCFGFAIAGTLASFRMFRTVKGTGALLLVGCMAWFIARESCIGYWYSEQKDAFYKVLDHLPQAETGLPVNAPIVIADPLFALTFRHYAPKDLAARVVFPVDFPAIRLYRHDDSPEENLWAGRGWLYSLPIVPLAQFQRTADEYVMIASDGNWMDQDLLHHRYPLWRLAINSRAGAIGGFTPLFHGTPTFYHAVGDLYFRDHTFAAPIPFLTAKTLPTGKLSPEEGGAFQDR